MTLVFASAVPARVRNIPLGYRPLLAALLSAGVMASAVAAEAPATSAVAVAAAAKTYAIGAAPLADVLNRFAAESGVILVFDASLLSGAQSSGLQGRFDVAAGFQKLLASSKYDVVLGQSGGYILRQRGVAVTRAQEAAADKQVALMLTAIDVWGDRPNTIEKLDREMIVNLPAINGDLTSLLKLNPNIQYSEAALSSATGGEIAPAEISIHGAKPYQNEILLDGVSISNDIDPGNKIVTTSPEFIPGSAQALAVDSSILCDIEVKDSNVSAEYGRFTGGVVSATICSARKRFGGSVSVGYTSSDWSTLFIDPAQQETFEQSSNADYQPHFKKWTYKTTLEARSDNGWGLLMSVVRKKSEIPLQHFTTTNSATTESREITQERVQNTLVLKADYTPTSGPHKAEVSLVYAPSSNSYFIEDYRDSDYTIKTGGLNLAGKWESRYAAATLTHRLAYSQNQQSRRSDANYYRNWRWSTDKSWGDATEGTNPASGEGAWGDVDQDSKKVEYKFRSAFTPFTAGVTTHRVVGGVDVAWQHGVYERLKEQYYYLTVASLPTTGAISRCAYADGSIDTEACSATKTLRQGLGQYFRTLNTYQVGKFSQDSNAWAAYLEDDAKWHSVVLRGGLRADRDSLTGKTNVAPRLKFGWQVTDPLYLDVGVNRYYGRNLFAYALQEKINTLKTVQTRAVGSLVWGASTVSKPLNRLEDVKSPYDDEVTAGATYDADWLAGPLTLRFTRRNGKDQIVKLLQTRQTDCNANNCYIYSNNGASVSKDLTLSWSSAQAFKAANTETRMWLAINKSDVESNYSSYADTYGTALVENELINYDGKVMPYSEKPADNYNRPWTLRIGAMSSVIGRDLTVSNILRIRGGYQQILENGTVVYDGASIKNFEKTDLPASRAIDTVVHWNPRVYRDQRLDVKLTVENITNQKNRVTVNDTYATYERGRTFAFEIGYGF